MSWHPDPNAFAVDAFSISWTSEKFYIFPPFSIIGRVMKKIRMEGTQCMLIVPDWPSQVWYNIHKEIQKRTIQFNNKPLSMTTQAIEMIVIPLPLNIFYLHPSSLFRLHNNGQCQVKTIIYIILVNIC